jgi:hypothetical protein
LIASLRNRDGSGYPFAFRQGKCNGKAKDISGQPDPSGWMSQGKGIAKKNKNLKTKKVVV